MNLNVEQMQYYLYKKVLKRKDSEEILKECERLKISLHDYLITKEIITEAIELGPMGEYYNIPSAEIDMMDVDDELVHQFSFELMKENKFMPINIDKNGVLLVAVANPMNFAAMSAISAVFTCETDYILTAPSLIDRYIDSISATIQTSAAIKDLNDEKDAELFSDQEDVRVISFSENEDDVINNPAVRLVDSIIKEAIPYGASDIHIEPFDKKVRVRYRIDGDLQERADFPIDAYAAISARIKILSGMNIAERRRPQDGRINLVVGGKEYDFRVSSLPTVYGEKFVIRILDKTSFRFTRTDLGFTDAENGVIDKIIKRPHGIVLLTGPTGCGKSTTLYSFLKEVNNTAVNIITVEDPVEYTMGGINQTQVNEKAEMTFAAALRSILRQDPDIIMIGEIRDEETAEIAVRASITGHLVFSTLHTNDAPGAITRLEDMGVPDYMVADALAGVIAQRLVKRLCPACKKRGKANVYEMKMLGIDEPLSIYRPVGCQYCNYTGYKGRIGVHEIMYMNDEMRFSVAKEHNAKRLRELAAENGMVSLYQNTRDLVLGGITSIQELVSLEEE